MIEKGALGIEELKAQLSDHQELVRENGRNGRRKVTKRGIEEGMAIVRGHSHLPSACFSDENEA